MIFKFELINNQFEYFLIFCKHYFFLFLAFIWNIKKPFELKYSQLYIHGQRLAPGHANEAQQAQIGGPKQAPSLWFHRHVTLKQQRTKRNGNSDRELELSRDNNNLRMPKMPWLTPVGYVWIDAGQPRQTKMRTEKSMDVEEEQRVEEGGYEKDMGVCCLPEMLRRISAACRIIYEMA